MKRKSSKIYVKKKSERKKSVKRPRKSKRVSSSRYKSIKSKKDDFGIKSNLKEVGNVLYDVVADTVKNPMAAVKNVPGAQYLINPVTEALAKGGVGWVAREGAEYLLPTAGAVAGVGLGGAGAALLAPAIGFGAGTAALVGGIAGAGMGKELAKQYTNTWKKWGDEQVNELREKGNDLLEHIPFTGYRAKSKIKSGLDEKTYRALRKHFFFIRDTQQKLNSFTEKFIKDCKQLYVLLQKYGINDSGFQNFVSVVSQEINRINSEIKDSMEKLKEGEEKRIELGIAIREYKTPNIIQTPVVLKQLRKSPIKPEEFKKIIEGNDKNKKLLQQARVTAPQAAPQAQQAAPQAQTNQQNLAQDKTKLKKRIDSFVNDFGKYKNRLENTDDDTLKNRYFDKYEITKVADEIKKDINNSQNITELQNIKEKIKSLEEAHKNQRETYISTLKTIKKENDKLKLDKKIKDKIKDLLNDKYFMFENLKVFKTNYDAFQNKNINQLSDDEKNLIDRNFLINAIDWNNEDDLKTLALQVLFK